jgi:hypothetical protein
MSETLTETCETLPRGSVLGWLVVEDVQDLYGERHLVFYHEDGQSILGARNGGSAVANATDPLSGSTMAGCTGATGAAKTTSVRRRFMGHRARSCRYTAT